MKMKTLALMMLPFLAAGSAVGGNTNQQQMGGNSQNGYAYTNAQNRKHKKNMLLVSKRTKLKHKLKSKYK
jgi:hypothetical protein